MTPEKLSAAVQLIKAGNRQAAIPLLKEVIQANPRDENAWLWMYACVDQAEQKKYCLQRVLEINPGHQGARQVLAKLTNPPPPAPPPSPKPRPAPRRKPRRRRFPLLPLLAGALLLLMICGLSFIFLTQTNLISSPALALFPQPTQTPTLTATATPSPSATATATSTPSPSPTLTPTATVTSTPSEVVEITWFSGFGKGSDTQKGTDRDQVAAMQSVVDDFNASQSYIHLNLEVTSYIFGPDQFRAAITAGQGPDIVGPMFLDQSNEFHNQWLDLTTYISLPDLQAYNNQQLVRAFHTKYGQMALPFVVDPSALFYNTKLFDKAGLKYPPAHYGETYEMPDGSQVEWDWDALAKVARLLTLDNKGLNATQSGFDKGNIVQYGYSWTYVSHPNSMGVYWGDGSMLADDGRTAQIPDAWRAAWEWTYDGVWGEHPFIPTRKVETSALLKKSHAFDSGKLGMAIAPDWSVPLIPTLKTWDLAAIPSYRGEPGGQVDAYSFFIWQGSKHPREAYTAMSYLLNQGVPKLMNVSALYPSMSARKDQQQAWVDAKKRQFPWVTNWDVFVAGLDYPETPNVFNYVPNSHLAWSRGFMFYENVFDEPHGNLAIEEQNYLHYLNQIFAGGE